MIKTIKPDFYIGVITGFKEESEKEEFIITADIPGIIQDIVAYPFGAMIDEPKIGDAILLCNLDPIYNSYYIYQKLKESNFIGFRASGKMVDITPDTITLGIFDPEVEYKDNERPEFTSKIFIDKDNNVTIEGENLNITINSDCNIQTNNCKIKADGDCIIESGSCNLKADNIEINGSTVIKGTDLTVGGTATPTSKGPFCAIPVCPFTGAPHIGDVVRGN